MLAPPAASSDDHLRRKAAPPRALLWLLIAIAGIGPMSLNILMPALPGIAQALQSDPQTVQLMLSLYLVCMALSQLILGALSDRFGRRPVLIGGLILTVAVSLAAIFAANIQALIAARALQAFGASTGIVISRAIVRDLYDRDRSASMLATVTMAIMVVPMIVPPLGGFLDSAFGWHAIFTAIALFAAGILTWVWVALPETHTIRFSSGGFVRFLQEARFLITDRTFIGYMLCGAASSALFFVFLGGAPQVIGTQQGRGAFELGFWIASASASYMLGNFVSARYSTRFGIDALIAVGVLIGVAGGIAVVVLALWYPQLGPLVICVPQWITALCNGLVIPNAIAGGISVRPQAAGTAAGIHGFVQMLISAVFTQWVSHLLADAGKVDPMAWMLFGFALFSAASFFFMVWRRAPRTAG